jgi:hypothetical protein
MRKIRLDMDALAVESFPTAGAEGRPAGTVRAHQDGAAPEVPTLETGHHGCYGCVHSVGCVLQTLLCADTAAGG